MSDEVQKDQDQGESTPESQTTDDEQLEEKAGSKKDEKSSQEEDKERKKDGNESDDIREAIKKEGRKESASGEPRPGRIDPQDLRRISDLFVPSTDFFHRLENRPDYNVLIVHGPEHAGKLTTAMKLALELLHCEPEAGKIYCYRRSLADSSTLIDLVKNKEKGRAYLLEDALEHAVGLRELTSPRLDALDRALKDRDSYLILTTEWKLRDLELLNVCKVSAFPEDLQQVFEKHLDRFARHVEGVDVLEQVVEAARGRWLLVSRYLKKPVQIERFCYKLGDVRSEISDKQLEELARDAAYIGQTSLRQAFGDLGDNQKLYALLAVLFDGIERGVLDEIYALSVRHLRAEGVSTLRDEREIGLEDILEQIHARESEARQIIIEDSDFRDAALHQIRNHRLLLYSLSNRLLSLCEQYSAPEHWEVRRAIGGALGRLAVQEKRGLTPVSQALDELASHEHGGIASIAGFILAQICREAPQFRGEVLARLNEWVKSGHPDRMWTAGAAAWRIYEALGQSSEAAGEHTASRQHRRVLGVIAALIRRAGRFSAAACTGASPEQVASWFHQNLRCAFFALVRIATASPLSAAGKLEEWLRSKSGDPVRDIAQFACREVLEQAVFGKRDLLPEEEAWLELIEPILTLDPDVAQVGDALMAALAHWSRWSAEEESREKIYSHLLKAANRLSGRAAKSFRAGLVRYWLTSSKSHVCGRGRALLRRSHAMEGLPARDLRPIPGLVTLDSSSEARSDPGASRFFREILEVAGCYTQVKAAHLGGSRIQVPPKEELKESDVRSPFPRPRLLLPLLERSSPDESADSQAIVALTWGPILDLADGEGSPWWPPLLVTVGDWSQTPEGEKNGEERQQTGDAAIPHPIPLTQDLDAIVTGIVRFLNSQPSRTLPKSGSSAPPWEDLAALDRAEVPIDSPDRAARIIAALLDWSVNDFAGCLRILHRWFDDSNELSRRVASAGVRALLRFNTEFGQRPAEVEKEELLRLAFRLSPTDEGAAKTVLETVLAWMDEEPWAERITGGDDLCLAWMRWFEGLIPHQARNLDRWLSRMKAQEATKKEEGTAVQQVLSRLRFRLSLGVDGALPALDDGKKYGLFLLDTFSSDYLTGARLAQLITELLGHQQLRDIPCLVFRLGRKAPLTVPGEKLAREAVLPASGARLPRLLGPILDELPPERILFALVLSSGSALDSSDWSESSWAPLIRLYGPTEGPVRSEPFVRISSPHEKDREAEFVLRNLKPLIEQGV
jgi:hypothetical protein